MGKWLVILGLAVAAIGAVVWLLERTGFHGLPGDIRYEGRGFRLYFPIISCIVLSAVLTLILWLIQWFTRR